MKYVKYLIFLTFLGVFVGRSFIATAVEDPRNKLVPYLNLEGANIHDALRMLFKVVAVPYTVDSNVQGSVTVKLENQPFETVLRNLLNQIGATYRVQGGVYEIVMRPSSTTPREYGRPEIGSGGTVGSEEIGIRRIFIQHADPQLIMTLLTQTYGSTLKLSPEMSVLIATGGAATGGGFSSGFGGSRLSSLEGGSLRGTGASFMSGPGSSFKNY